MLARGFTACFPKTGDLAEFRFEEVNVVYLNYISFEIFFFFSCLKLFTTLQSLYTHMFILYMCSFLFMFLYFIFCYIIITVAS